jgi:hypothetical protein
MSRYFYIPVFFIIVLFIWSCSPYRYIDIQVLKPAQVAWSHKIDTLFVIETIKINERDTSIQNRLQYLKFLYNFNKALIKELKESPILVNSNIRSVSYDYASDKYAESTFEERKHIYACSINSIKTRDTTYISKFYGEFGTYTLVTYRIIYIAKVRFSNYINMTHEITVEDTVWWESLPIYYNPSDVKVSANKTEAFMELGELVAENLAKKNAPYWASEERAIFYASNKMMRRGYKSFVENNSSNAINYWTEVYNSGTKRLAAMASYNIALSYETIDSLNLSKDWLEKSVKLKNDSVTLRYLGHIKNRIKEKGKLDEQFKIKSEQIN